MIEAKCIRNFNPFTNKPEKELVIGKSYEVEYISMGQSFTFIALKEFKNSFNSVDFEFYENGKPLDIYKDLRFNPYLKKNKQFIHMLRCSLILHKGSSWTILSYFYCI